MCLASLWTTRLRAVSYFSLQRLITHQRERWSRHAAINAGWDKNGTDFQRKGGLQAVYWTVFFLKRRTKGGKRREKREGQVSLSVSVHFCLRSLPLRVLLFSSNWQIEGFKTMCTCYVLYTANLKTWPPGRPEMYEILKLLCCFFAFVVSTGRGKWFLTLLWVHWRGYGGAITQT